MRNLCQHTLEERTHLLSRGDSVDEVLKSYYYIYTSLGTIFVVSLGSYKNGIKT